MAKKVIVGGRIESKEVGGIVTGAAEILDDSKGKKQSVINQETDAELLRLDQSKQNNLTFDNVPTEGSNNPVKSGGLYTAQQAILLAIAAINELIPSAASVLNQLADKAFVNSSISTNTATFRGTSAAGLNEQQFLAWANGLEHDLNDYVFWQTSDAAGNTLFKRYKWNGTDWAYEYTLNNSTFTAEQWEAIQSGITALLVAKLRALPTAQELIQSFDGKQDVLTFDNVPTFGSTNPVKSSGIFNAIKEVSDALATFINETEALIPAEATAQNQLADKADVAAKILAAIPSWKGQYDALTDLQAVTGAKAGDMGCVKTTDSDGHAVLTFYQYSAQGTWVVYYTLRHYAQNKPATTGTTGDYPYNGMGRIELQKNIVNGVNTLTQAMLTQQNTIYVIQYDFTLGENITVPANCVLEFDGGSISGAYTLTGNNTIIKTNNFSFLSINTIFAGSFITDKVDIRWFGADINNEDNTDNINAAIKFAIACKIGKVYIPIGKYDIKGELLVSTSVVNNDNLENIVIEGVRENITNSACSNINLIGASAKLTMNMAPVSGTLSGFRISDILFTGDGTNKGIVTFNAQVAFIERCSFMGLEYGAYLTKDSHMIHFDGCKFYGNTYGIYTAKNGDTIYGAGQVNNCTVINCGFFINGNPIYLNESNGWVIESCDVETDNGSVVLSKNNIIKDVRFESSTVGTTWLQLNGDCNIVNNVTFHIGNGHNADTLIKVNGNLNNISAIFNIHSISYIVYDSGKHNNFDVSFIGNNYTGSLIFDETAKIKINGTENTPGSIQPKSLITSHDTSYSGFYDNLINILGNSIKPSLEYRNELGVTIPESGKYFITSFGYYKNVEAGDNVAGYLYHDNTGDESYEYIRIKGDETMEGRWVYIINIRDYTTSINTIYLTQQDNAHPYVRACIPYINVSKDRPCFFAFDLNRFHNLIKSNSDGTVISIQDKDSLFAFSNIKIESGYLKFECLGKTYTYSGYGNTAELTLDT